MVRHVALLTIAALHVCAFYSVSANPCSENPTISDCYPDDMITRSCYHSPDACNYSGGAECWDHNAEGKNKLKALFNCYKGRTACNIVVTKELAKGKADSKWTKDKLKKWTPENVALGKTHYPSAEAFVDAHRKQAREARAGYVKCIKTKAGKYGEKPTNFQAPKEWA